MAFFDHSKSDMKVDPGDYSSPMQEDLDTLAKQLSSAIDLKHAEFDPDIYKKYRVKKYIATNSKGKRVEAWIFDDKSLLTPIIEDHVTKRCQSLIMAAHHIFTEQKIPTDKLQQFETTFLAHLATIKMTAETAKELTEKLINDIALLWSTSSKVVSMSHTDFIQKLLKETERPPFADFQMSDILVLNRHPDVRSVQYYERGTKKISQDEKAPPLDYFSSHYRIGEGVSNFVACGKGFITDDGIPQITDVSFRHSSLPPIDLYKVKYKGSGPQLETVEITTRNLQHLGEEARSRLEKKSESSNQLLYLMNINLMTVHGHEKQDRQFHETILAADRLRSRDSQNIIPVTHAFGVNWLAKGSTKTRIYPAEQQFENQRAFFQTQEIFFSALKKVEAVDELNEIMAVVKYYDLQTKALRDVFKSLIEDPLRPYAQAFDVAMNEFQREKKSSDKEKAAKKCLDDLNNKKASLQAKSNEILLAYKKTSTLMLKDMRDALKKQAEKFKNMIKTMDAKKDKKKLNIITNFLFAIEDMCQYQDLFLSDRWSQDNELYNIQAHLHSLGNCLDRLKVAMIAMSKNCKSGNDRTFTADVHDDQIRLERQFGLLQGVLRLADEFHQNHLNYKSHCAGGAWVFVTPIVTGGGASKPSKSGHPYPEYCVKQNELEGLATHKLAKKYKTSILKKPKKIDKSRLFQLEDKKDDVKPAQLKLLEQQYTQLIQTLVEFQLEMESKSKEFSPLNICKKAVEDFHQFMLHTITPMVVSGVFDKVVLLEGEKLNHLRKMLDIAASSLHGSALSENDPMHPLKLKENISKSYHEFLKTALTGSLRQSQTEWMSSVPGAKDKVDALLAEKKVQDFKSWKKTIERSAKQVFAQPIKGVGDFFNKIGKAAKAVTHSDSKSTKNVNDAYQLYLEKKASDISGQFEQLENIQSAVDRWLGKHRGTQFENSKGDHKQSDSLELREDSRIPAMLALREWVVQEMENLTTKYSNEDVLSQLISNGRGSRIG